MKAVSCILALCMSLSIALTQPTPLPNQVQKILPTAAQDGDAFGRAISASDDLVLIGRDEASNRPVSADLYGYSANQTWELLTTLQASGQGTGAFFTTVALDGDRALLGSRFQSGSGRVYVFEKNAITGLWQQVAILSGSQAMSGDRFGTSVSLDGDYAVIGALGDDVGGGDAGAAYVFERTTQGLWQEVAYLKAPQPEAAAWFGSAVSLSGNWAAVGSLLEDPGGVVYLFERNAAGQWNLDVRIEASDVGFDDRFGSPVVLLDDTLLVGAPNRSELGFASGAAYVFERQADGSWAETAKLLGHDTKAVDVFGVSAAMAPGRILIGAALEDADAPNSGATYVFERQGDGSWAEILKIKDIQPAADDRLGVAVGLNMHTAFVCNERDDEAALDAGSVIVIGPLADPRPDLQAVYDTAFLPQLSWYSGDFPSTTSYQVDRQLDPAIGFEPLPLMTHELSGQTVATDTLLSFDLTVTYRLRADFENGLSTRAPDVNLDIPSKICPLRLHAVCSADPLVSRRWRIKNRNDFYVPVIWAQWWSPQRDTLLAAPGHSFFHSQTNAQDPLTGPSNSYGDDNITGLWWVNDQLSTASTWNFPCLDQCPLRVAAPDLEGETVYLPRPVEIQIPPLDGAAPDVLHLQVFHHGQDADVWVSATHRAELELLDQTGRQLWTGQYEEAMQKQRLPLYPFPAGIYYIRARNDKMVATQVIMLSGQ